MVYRHQCPGPFPEARVVVDAAVGDEHGAGRGGAARGFFLAVSEKAVLAARRTDEERVVELLAQQFRSQVDLVNVGQEARTQNDAVEGQPVFLERNLVLAAFVHVVESDRVEQRFCQLAEVEDVGEFSGVGELGLFRPEQQRGSEQETGQALERFAPVDAARHAACDAIANGGPLSTFGSLLLRRGHGFSLSFPKWMCVRALVAVPLSHTARKSPGATSISVGYEFLMPAS